MTDETEHDWEQTATRYMTELVLTRALVPLFCGAALVLGYVGGFVTGWLIF